MQNTFWRKVVALGQVSMTRVLVASESEAHPSPLIQTMMLGENRVDHFCTSKDHAKCSKYSVVVLHTCTQHYVKYHVFFINRYVTSATVKSSWGHPGESVTNLDISYLVVFTLQIVCDAILVWGAMKKIPNHLVPWLWANAVIIAVFLVSIFAVSKKLEMNIEFVL